jgi:hypothetical protein
VLADYDKRANEILATPYYDHYKFDFIFGAEEYWRRLHATGDFFLSLELMPDAAELLYYVEQTGREVKVLTALPKTNPEAVKSQKEAWIELNLGSKYEVICCKTPEKPNYCKPGDVIIDDRYVNAPAWIKAGGIYIMHTTARESINSLMALGI